MTIINKEVAKEHKLKWKKSKVTLTSATGAEMKVSGEMVLFAKVKNGQRRKKQNFLQNGRKNFLKLSKSTTSVSVTSYKMI